MLRAGVRAWPAGGAAYFCSGLFDVNTQHLRQFAGEGFDLGAIPDARHQLGGLPERIDATVSAIKVVAGGDIGQHEAIERHAAGHQLPNRRVALFQAQVARVHAGRFDGDVGLGNEVLVTREGPQGGLLARGVAVEGEDHLAAELLVVMEEAAKDPGMVISEGGAAGRHRGGYAGQVAGHHVGVALDHHRLRGARDVSTGQIDAVEHLALLVDRRLRSVEVLRLDPVVVEDPPRAESDGVASRVADRPEQAPAEPVVEAALSLGHQTADHQLLVAEPAATQVLEEYVVALGCEANPESCTGLLVEAALVQELTSHQRIGRAQRLRVELLGSLVRLDEPTPLRTLGSQCRRVTFLAPQLHAVLVGESSPPFRRSRARRSSSRRR